MTHYDLIVIGAGPGGYVTAIYGAKHGLKTAIIEKGNTLGGTCLNVGCIPTKTLIETTTLLKKINSSKDFAITVEKPAVDFGKLMKKKDRVVSRLTKGIEFLMKENDIDVIQGTASFKNNETITVNNDNYTFKHAVIATGSVPSDLPHIKADEDFIITSTGALSLEKVPENLVIIGGGVIGVEFAAIYSALGSNVTIVELMDQLLPGMDKDIAEELEKALKKSKIKTITSAGVTGCENGTVTYEKDGESVQLTADKILLSVGRRPNTHGLGLENTSIDTERGHVVVDEHLETSVKGVYAIGDVIDTMKLAHLASREGMKAVHHILSIEDTEDINTACPGVVYSYPEIASVGLTKADAEKKGINASEHTFPLTANSKGYVEGIKSGFVKAVVDTGTDTLIGLHIIGGKASEMIGEGTIAVRNQMKISDLGRIIHPHPTVSESILETFHMAEGHSIHI